MAKSVLQIVIKTLKEGNADKQTISTMESLKSAVGKATAVAATMAATYAVVDQTLGESVRTTLDYADQVRKMSEITGTSADEASKLIQVMDDYKISTDQLATATKKLAENGMTMSIETMAKLSDKYVKLGTGAERTKFLIDNFGKAGLDMAEAMSKGGDAIRSAAEQVDKHLILTQESVDAAREYQIQIDNLNDAWTAWKVNVGTSVIPIMNDVLNGLNIQAEMTGKSRNEIIAYIQGMKSAADASDSATQSYTAMAKSYEETTKATQDTTEATREMEDANKAAEAAAKAVSDANRGLISTIQSMQDIETRYTEKSTELHQQRIDLEAKIREAKSRTDEESKSQLADYQQTLADIKAQEAELEKERERQALLLISNILLQKLELDGLTTKEFEAFAKQQQAWGLWSDGVVDSAKKAWNEAQKIADTINNIPADKSVNVNVNYTNNPPPAEAKAKGGPVETDNVYWVGEKGPEIFIPNTDGTIIPNDQIVSPMANQRTSIGVGGGGGFVMNVNVSSMINTANDYALQNALYPAFLAMVNRARSDGVL